MRLPIFSRVKKDKLFRISTFGGLNRTSGCREDEFSQMKNLSSKSFPSMSPVSDWAVFGEDISDFFIYENDIFKIDKNGDLYKNTQLIREGVGTSPREYSVIGNYLVIMPDKLYYNMESGEAGSLEGVWEDKGHFVSGPDGLADILIVSRDISAVFKVGDCVRIGINGEYRGDYCISEINNWEILIENADFSDATQESDITLERRIPDLENTFECNNRLWGTNGNTIYASALGDPFNFYKYRGISTDSYFKEVYSAGDFTSGIAFGETPLFFKENAIYRIYGNTPSDFVMDSKKAPGVSFDCRHSAVNLGGSVYYAASDGIYVYTSAYPSKISEPLGDLRIGNANGGTDGRRYYISFSVFNGIHDDMAQVISAYHNKRFYAFDSENGCWYKYDDDLRICKVMTGIYVSVFKKPNTMALEEDGRLIGISDKLAGTTMNFVKDGVIIPSRSMGVSGVIDFGAASRISSIRLTLKTYENTELTGEISFDGGEFEPFCNIVGGNGITEKRSFRVRRKRFSYCRLRFTGKGEYELSAVDMYYSHSDCRER